MKTRPDSHRLSTAARSTRRMQKPRSRSSRTSVDAVVFKRILVPVDFTAGSDRALRHAASLARTQHARVLPVHVTPPICYTGDCGYGPVNRVVPDEDSLRRTRARLQRLVHRIVPRELAEAVIVQSGEPTDQIVRAAKQWRADLIIMLAHEVLGKNSVPPTHTVDRLVRQVLCPVLVLHAGRPRQNRMPISRRGTS
jgi:nucleotide-binding universal stress UspA family protein